MSRYFVFSSKQSWRRLSLAIVCVVGLLLGRLTMIDSSVPVIMRDHVPLLAPAEYKVLPHFDLQTVSGAEVSCHDVLHRPFAVLLFGSFT